MNSRKAKIGIGIILLLIIASVFYFWLSLNQKGIRNLGDLSSPCNKEYKINITHYREFDNIQPLYFNIKKNGKTLTEFGGNFEITNNMDESLDNFEIHCYDNILYVTWKNNNYPVIIFDTKSNYIYFHNSDNIKYKKMLFERIKKGNQKLEIE